ncbi:MAG TPA: BTAD domain-containing putative transcriptional regulator, partial [Chthonomonadaceae bacterium]|nr:BTAD domain-containing putative transcriptional regulator [Chthonomonadaceae bacterium]
MTASKATTAPLTLRLFGPMQAFIQGQPLPRLRSQKALWLLALLALRSDAPVQREWLAGVLWPDSDQSQSSANLRVVLSELRRALGSEEERLQSPDRHTLVLDLTGADVDVRTFDAAIAGKQLPALEQAVALYQGPLLEGCSEEWVFQERRLREQECLQALQRLADTAMAAGDYGSAIPCFQHAVSLDPWCEAAQRGWMEALAKGGDTNAALQVYREFIEVLKSDPKAVPDAQTSALYQRLRSEARQRADTHAVVTAQVAPVPMVKGYLPQPLTDLVGREDERVEVARQLRRFRLVTLTGLGGIGKTRLAREVAREVLREYADGVWLVALEALSEGRQVVQQIASVLGLQEEPGRPLQERVTEQLRTRRLLLMLDNCEHLQEASAAIVGHLLRECREVRVLATSRMALGIPGELAWSVPALAVPDMEHMPQGRATLLRVLMGYESVQLFVERAQAIQKTFVLSGSNALMVGQVCRQLEGIPLAIELAAARVKAMTIEQIASRLHNELDLLTGGSRTALSRQQTLRATLAWSYALLSAPERSLLQRLSAFAGGWPLEAAERIFGGEDNEAQRVSDLLTSLADKSLVVWEAREEGGRYRLLEIVRQYAAEQLEASSEGDRVRTAHRDWCVAFVEEAEPHLRGAQQGEWMRRLDTEYDNLRAALTRSPSDIQGALAHLRLVGVLWRFWYTRGRYSEGRKHMEQALGRAEAQAPTSERARALEGAANLCC